MRDERMTGPDVWVVGAARTPMGSFGGELAGFSAPALGAAAIRAALARATLDPARVDEVYFGTVVAAAQGQAPARQAALDAGLPPTVPCTTVNKVCGSGMKSVMIAADQIRAGGACALVAGGMESMSGAPFLLRDGRRGLRPGPGTLQDSLFTDGLEDAASGESMGVLAQRTADACRVARETMDDYALDSLRRAQRAQAEGWLGEEIAPVAIPGGARRVAADEQPGRARAERVRQLAPAFAAAGSLTPATTSSLSDGAAALVLLGAAQGQPVGLPLMGRIVAQASYAGPAADFCLAPVGAIRRVLAAAGWSAADVDLFEINEAFALVPLLAIRALELDRQRVNVHGGACSLGHPLGASGARILVTLLYALRRLGRRRGVAALCIGGGEATAVAVECPVG